MTQTFSTGQMIKGLLLLVTPGIFSMLSTSVAMGANSIGTLSKVLGSVTIVRAGKNIPGKNGTEIFETDVVSTSKRSAAKILFKDGSSFMAMENAKFKVDEYKIQGTGKEINLKSAISVGKGVVRFFVKPREGAGKNDAKFRTPNAVMGIRGTSGFIDNSNPNKTQLVVLTGKVEVASPFNPGKSVMVIPNHLTEVAGRNPPTPPVKAPEALVTNLNSEASKVEPATEGMPPAAAPASSNEEKKEEKQDEKREEKKEEKREEKKENNKKEDAKEQKPAAEEKKSGGTSEPSKTDDKEKPKPAAAPQERKSEKTEKSDVAPAKRTGENRGAKRDTVVFSPVGDKPQLSPIQPTQALIPAGKIEAVSSAQTRNDTSPKTAAEIGVNVPTKTLPDLRDTTSKINQRVEGVINNAIEKSEIVKETEVTIEIPRGPIKAK